MADQIMAAVLRLPVEQRASTLRSIMNGVGRVTGTVDLSAHTAQLTQAVKAEGGAGRAALRQAIREALAQQVAKLVRGPSALGANIGGVQTNVAINTIGSAVNMLTGAAGSVAVSALQQQQQRRQLNRDVSETIQSWYQPATQLTFAPQAAMPWGTIIVGGVAVAGVIAVALYLKRRGKDDDTAAR